MNANLVFWLEYLVFPIRNFTILEDILHLIFEVVGVSPVTLESSFLLTLYIYILLWAWATVKYARTNWIDFKWLTLIAYIYLFKKAGFLLIIYRRHDFAGAGIIPSTLFRPSKWQKILNLEFSFSNTIFKIVLFSII